MKARKKNKTNTSKLNKGSKPPQFLTLKNKPMKLTKSGHPTQEQYWYNEYIKENCKHYKGYEYTIVANHILCIYEDGELVKSAELTAPKWTFDNWAKYYIQGLINK